MRKRRAKHDKWAAKRFGHLRAADRRLTARTVAVAAGIARRPSGAVTAVFESASEREGAYRLLENNRLEPGQIEEALGVATARACAEEDVVLVPVDGSSLNLVDTQCAKGFGVVGSYRIGARGVIVQTALAVSERGVPIDVAAQRYWARHPGQAGPNETSHVIEMAGDVLARMAENAPKTKVWFQFDRGYDIQPLLSFLRDSGACFTIRSKALRRITDGRTGQRRYLQDVLRRAVPLGEYFVDVPEKQGSARRQARVVVRAAPVVLFMKRKSKARERMSLWIVEAKEQRKDGLLWRLLTSEPAGTFEAALRVVRAYESRWRIEDFHRAWKSGVCNVEDTQLRSVSAVTKWATLHAAVAARAIRLARLARETPELPADIEFTRREILALVALAKKKRLRPGDPVPTLGKAIEMVAKLGGYTGKSSGGPPGAITIGRGLRRVLDVAAVAGLFPDE